MQAAKQLFPRLRQFDLLRIKAMIFSRNSTERRQRDDQRHKLDEVLLKLRPLTPNFVSTF